MRRVRREVGVIIESLQAMRIAYIPSGTAVPPAHTFADPNRKRMFQPGIYCIPTGRLSIIRGKKGASEKSAGGQKRSKLSKKGASSQKGACKKKRKAPWGANLKGFRQSRCWMVSNLMNKAYFTILPWASKMWSPRRM